MRNRASAQAPHVWGPLAGVGAAEGSPGHTVGLRPPSHPPLVLPWLFLLQRRGPLAWPVPQHLLCPGTPEAWALGWWDPEPPRPGLSGRSRWEWVLSSTTCLTVRTPPTTSMCQLQGDRERFRTPAPSGVVTEASLSSEACAQLRERPRSPLESGR